MGAPKGGSLAQRVVGLLAGNRAAAAAVLDSGKHSRRGEYHHDR